MQRRAERRRSVASPVDHSEQVSSGTCETALLDDVLFRDGCGRSRGSIPFSFCQGHSRTSTQRLKGRYRPSSREERAKKAMEDSASGQVRRQRAASRRCLPARLGERAREPTSRILSEKMWPSIRKEGNPSEKQNAHQVRGDDLRPARPVFRHWGGTLARVCERRNGSARPKRGHSSSDFTIFIRCLDMQTCVASRCHQPAKAGRWGKLLAGRAAAHGNSSRTHDWWKTVGRRVRCFLGRGINASRDYCRTRTRFSSLAERDL